MYYCLLNIGHTIIFFFPNNNTRKVKEKLKEHNPTKDPRSLLSHKLTGKGLGAFKDENVKKITDAFFHMLELRNWINYGPNMVWESDNSKFKIDNLLFSPKKFLKIYNTIDDLILGMIKYLIETEESVGYRISFLIDECKPFFLLEEGGENLVYYREWSSTICLEKCEEFRLHLQSQIENIILSNEANKT